MENTKNNQVKVNGMVASELTYSHEVLGEKFYVMNVVTKRSSGTEDKIPVMVSERLLDVTEDHIGENVEIEGEYRSRNVRENEKSRLELHLFARRIYIAEEEAADRNEIILNGYICKTPIYRTTPLGREICDVLIAVNRAYSKSDYIPCVVWGRNARFVSGLEVGAQVKLTGRIQSREYVKKHEDFSETKTAYEVSVAIVEPVTEREEEIKPVSKEAKIIDVTRRTA